MTHETVADTNLATPVFSGVVALMLDANPEIGYRDVRQILALSAKKSADASTIWQDNHAVNGNGGTMHVSHGFSFGEVNALAAVRLAETWTRRSKLSNESTFSASVSGGDAGNGENAQACI